MITLLLVVSILLNIVLGICLVGIFKHYTVMKTAYDHWQRAEKEKYKHNGGVATWFQSPPYQGEQGHIYLTRREIEFDTMKKQ